MAVLEISGRKNKFPSFNDGMHFALGRVIHAICFLGHGARKAATPRDGNAIGKWLGKKL
jgi:hypothetical protein